MGQSCGVSGSHIYRPPLSSHLLGYGFVGLTFRKQPYFPDLRLLRRHLADTPMY